MVGCQPEVRANAPFALVLRNYRMLRGYYSLERKEYLDLVKMNTRIRSVEFVSRSVKVSCHRLSLLPMASLDGIPRPPGMRPRAANADCPCCVAACCCCCPAVRWPHSAPALRPPAAAPANAPAPPPRLQSRPTARALRHDACAWGRARCGRRRMAACGCGAGLAGSNPDRSTAHE